MKFDPDRCAQCGNLLDHQDFYVPNESLYENAGDKHPLPNDPFKFCSRRCFVEATKRYWQTKTWSAFEFHSISQDSYNTLWQLKGPTWMYSTFNEHVKIAVESYSKAWHRENEGRLKKAAEAEQANLNEKNEEARLSREERERQLHALRRK